jgi:predicted phosphohydrolase
MNSLNEVMVVGLTGQTGAGKSTVSKVFAENGFSTLNLLFNNAYETESVIVCGCRGWYTDEKNSPDNADYGKIVAREAGRLRLSLNAAQKFDANKKRVVFFHFPPVFGDFICEELVDVLCEFGVKECYYGHIHGDYTMPHTVSHEGIEFSLISADYLEFIPKNIPQKTISGDIITKISEDT